MPSESLPVKEVTYIVKEADTAYAGGGESYPMVLSTPRMIGWMESTAHTALFEMFKPGQTSVGTVVNIRHLAATPVGMEVRVRAELLRMDGRRCYFQVEAWDGQEKIGDGEHERFIIDRERFEKRLEEKRQAM